MFPGRRMLSHEVPMRTMNSEAYDSLIDTDIAEIKASLLVLKWMAGFILALVVALAWRTFQ